MKYWTKNLYVLWIRSFFAATSYALVVPFLSLFLRRDGRHGRSGVVGGAVPLGRPPGERAHVAHLRRQYQSRHRAAGTSVGREEVWICTFA